MRARLFLVALCVTLVAAACGNSDSDDEPSGGGTTVTTAGGGDTDTFVESDEPGVTDDEIRVAVIASKTNPLGGKYAEIEDGIEAYFAMVNDAGGIYGRDLVVVKNRDDIIGTQNLQQVQASLAEDNAFATFLASLGFPGADELDAAGMPTFIWNIRPEMAGHDNIFGNIGAICFGCPGQVLPWLADEIGAEKVGILGYNVARESVLCAEGNRDSFEKYGSAEVGFYDASLGFAQPDLSAQVAAMKDAGVELVTTCMDANETLVLAKEMKKQGLDAVQNLPNGYDADFIRANAEFFEGSYVTPQFLAFEHGPIPEHEEFERWIAELDRPTYEVTVVGWILARMFVEGLELAGPEFTQEGVIGALNTLTDFTANGMVVPIDWTKQHEDPAKNPDAESDLECANVVQVRDGEFVPVFAEDDLPWVCFENNAPELTRIDNRSFVPEE
ncbi:MAG TPA: ABC transporter substrate-binding protein [Acidimicrobiia bacterium]|nr:ABC transporter substrate-binding protein [Acidimicrobiia bacterium]